MADLKVVSNCSSVKIVPPVPIKTYKWEDIRRSRLKGSYPWTYLYKDPFDEFVDPSDFKIKMESNIRKTKSSSAIEPIKKDEKYDLKGSLNDIQLSVVEEESKEQQRIDVPQNCDNVNNDLKDIGKKDYNENKETQEIKMDIAEESLGSSADVSVSQYLDKEADSVPSPSTSANPALASEETDTNREKRAKSEEPKRKRKHSIDSSYSRVSRYSLSKLGVVKSLKEARDKIKEVLFGKTDANTNKKKKVETPATSKTEKPSIREELKKFNIKPDLKKGSKKSTQQEKKAEGPLFIHIPLKPPPGETDEFSYLEFEEPVTESGRKPSPIKEEENETVESVESPIEESPAETPRGVQLIILTAPSDDEILVDRVPETPSETDSVDNKRFEELKTIAKEVVDRYSPQTKRKELNKQDVISEETEEDERTMESSKNAALLEENNVDIHVTDEVVIDKPETQPEVATVEVITKKKKKIKKIKAISQSEEDTAQTGQMTDDDKIEERKAQNVQSVENEIRVDESKDIDEQEKMIINNIVVDQPVKMLVDEEDGLKETEVLKLDIIQDIPVEKEGEPSVSLKKKVSFRKKSKSGEEGYEEVQPQHEEDNGLGRSMSTEEEKSYNDTKLIKETSLEEDYNKWSNIQDHEYEPINPPPEEEGQKSAASSPISDSDIEYLAAKAADIEMRTKGIISTTPDNPNNAIFVPLESALKMDANQSDTKEPKLEKLQTALRNQAENIKNQAGKLKTRVASIKRPKRPSLPKLKIDKPKVSKWKIEKPKMPKMPKIPDQVKLTFTMPHKTKKTKHITETIQYASTTESIPASDSKKKPLFDFSTYPRMFSKKKKAARDVNTPRSGTECTPSSESSTMPRLSKFWKGKFTEHKTEKHPKPVVQQSTKLAIGSELSSGGGSTRIPLHSDSSMEREDSVERRMAMDLAAREAYANEDVAMDEEYMKENQQIHDRASPYKFSDRWHHGTFHQDSENHGLELYENGMENSEPSPPPRRKPRSESVEDVKTRGVLEEINSDEFFLRQKGISQDNIEVGAYLSSEIREAFRSPTDYDSELKSTSNTSLPETTHKQIRKPLRKTKPKKTPHVSQERFQQEYDQDEFSTIDLDDIKPERPHRRQKTRVHDYDIDGLEDQIISQDDLELMSSDIHESNILSDFDLTESLHRRLYENEHMTGIEQPGIIVSDPYQEAFYHPNLEMAMAQPSVPTRRNKSSKSLSSEHDSISGELNEHPIHNEADISYRLEHEYQIPTPDGPPKRPSRTRSRTSSHSRTASQPEDDLIVRHRDFGQEKSVSEQCIPCQEEPCRQIRCDNMGYSIIDKSRSKESALPPKIPGRRSLKGKTKKGVEDDGQGFFTVPRQISQESDVPVRPTRNYSTLGPARPPRKRSSVPNLTDEEKGQANESFDESSAYIEIEEDVSHKLISGEVIQKMKGRPLPAPPRPPRKSRERSLKSESRGPVSDISHDRAESIISDFGEQEVSVQTEPLPDGFELSHEDVSKEIIDVEDINDTAKEYRPRTNYEHEETVTHGALIVRPFGENEVIDDAPIQMISKSTERIITVKREFGEKDSNIEPSEGHIIERIIERQVPIQFESPTEIEILKATKLQISDLDVDRLAVNELLANRIRVADIDSSSLRASEINTASGNLVVSGIELPASFFQQIVDKLQKEVSKQQDGETSKEQEEKEKNDEEQAAATGAGPANLIGQNKPWRAPPSEHQPRQYIEPDIDFEDPPRRPPRLTKFPTEIPTEEVSRPETPPPPRPPQLPTDYDPFPSEPQTGFYNLPPNTVIYQELEIDDNIPIKQKRKRHMRHKAPPMSESSSEFEVAHLGSTRRRHRHLGQDEPTVAQLSGQLVRACAHACDCTLRRLIHHMVYEMLGYPTAAECEGKRDDSVIIVILIVLIACLILFGWGDGRMTIHHHHWEYFNPPKEI